MTSPVVVAVDPGGRFTGIVSRHGLDLVEHTLLVRGRKDDLQNWLDTVRTAAIRHYMERWKYGHRDIIVAVENLNDPTPQMGTMSVRGLLDTATVIGALMASMGGVVMVPPGGHGSGPRQAYPAQLWGREVKGTGALRHCRSAWDVAGAAAAMAKMGVG